MKSRLIKLARYLVAALLVTYVLYRTNLFTAEGWREFLTTILSGNPYWLVLALLYIPVIDFVSTLKWHYLARKMGFSQGLRQLFIYYIVGRFFNLVLPSSIGGDVIRVHLLGKEDKRYAQAAAVVFIERLTGVLVLVALAFFVSYLALSEYRAWWLDLGFAAAALGLIALIWFVVDVRLLNWVSRWLGERHPLLTKLIDKAKKFHAAVAAFRNAPMTMTITILYSLLFYLFAIGNVWITLKIFAGDASFVSMLYAVPLIMFIMNIPLSIGGIGIAEFAYTLVLPLVGYTPEVALSVALLMRLKSLLAGAVGAGIYPLVSKWGVSLEEIQARNSTSSVQNH